MDTNEKNLALCKAMGIVECDQGAWTLMFHGNMGKTGTCTHKNCRPPGYMPDYFSNEKAILDATRAQEPVVQSLVSERLIDMMRDKFIKGSIPNNGLAVIDLAIHADASDRADALGRALYLW